jgi:hypothetical protein
MISNDVVRVGEFKGTPGLRCAYCRGDDPDVVFRKSNGQHYFFHERCFNSSLSLAEKVLPVYEKSQRH